MVTEIQAVKRGSPIASPIIIDRNLLLKASRLKDFFLFLWRHDAEFTQSGAYTVMDHATARLGISEPEDSEFKRIFQDDLPDSRMPLTTDSQDTSDLCFVGMLLCDYLITSKKRVMDSKEILAGLREYGRVGTDAAPELERFFGIRRIWGAPYYTELGAKAETRNRVFVERVRDVIFSCN